MVTGKVQGEGGRLEVMSAGINAPVFLILQYSALWCNSRDELMLLCYIIHQIHMLYLWIISEACTGHAGAYAVSTKSPASRSQGPLLALAVGLGVRVGMGGALSLRLFQVPWATG